jgi:Putative bacterial sensory transduction regulator
MKRLFAFAAVATLFLLTAPPVSAVITSSPVPAQGVSREEIAKLLTERGWPAKIANDSNGAPIVSSRVDGVNFDVYFYQCENGLCRDIQFAAGWSNSTASPDRINQWNTTKRFLRVYWKPGKIIWAEMDARIARGTTANIDENLALWAAMLSEFKQFFKF